MGWTGGFRRADASSPSGSFPTYRTDAGPTDAEAGSHQKSTAGTRSSQGGRGSNDEPPLGQEKLQMKIHLAWIRVTAAAALVGVGVHPAAAQYAPFKPLPPDAVAPAATYPAAGYPTAAYPTAAIRRPPIRHCLSNCSAGAGRYVASRVPAAYPQTQYQAPAAHYQTPARLPNAGDAYQPAQAQ